MIFENTNPTYCDFQRKCIDYYKTHAPEKNYEEEMLDEAQEKGEGLDQKEESYEEKLYYNFQTMKDILGKNHQSFILKFFIILTFLS